MVCIPWCFKAVHTQTQHLLKEQVTNQAQYHHAVLVIHVLGIPLRVTSSHCPEVFTHRCCTKFCGQVPRCGSEMHSQSHAPAFYTKEMHAKFRGLLRTKTRSDHKKAHRKHVEITMRSFARLTWVERCELAKAQQPTKTSNLTVVVLVVLHMRRGTIKYCIHELVLDVHHQTRYGACKWSVGRGGNNTSKEKADHAAINTKKYTLRGK